MNGLVEKPRSLRTRGSARRKNAAPAQRPRNVARRHSGRRALSYACAAFFVRATRPAPHACPPRTRLLYQDHGIRVRAYDTPAAGARCRRKAWCNARTAFVASSSATTIEMFRSDDPCEIAVTLMPAL